MEAKKGFVINIVFYGMVVAIVLLLGKYVLPIMTPFIIAFAVASLFNWITKLMGFKRESLRRTFRRSSAGKTAVSRFIKTKAISSLPFP